MKPDKTHLFLSVLFILATISLIVSCVHKADISDLPEICFDNEVLPIYRNSCAKPGCHDGTGESALILNSFATISYTVVPFDPEASQSYKAITTTWGEMKMPPDEPLSKDNRTIIRLWIEQGALQTTCPAATVKDGTEINKK
jgi:hypothetical protein